MSEKRDLFTSFTSFAEGAFAPTEKPAWADYLGKRVVTAGAVGAAYGATLATWRGHSPLVYSTNMGANYAIASCAFFGSALLLRQTRGKEDVLNYVGAGMLSGTFLTLPFCGPARSLAGGAAVAALGAAGYLASLRLQVYFDKLAAERRKELYGEAAVPATGTAQPQDAEELGGRAAR